LLQQNFWLQQQKKIFVVPNFVAVTKPFFSVRDKNGTFAARISTKFNLKANEKKRFKAL